MKTEKEILSKYETEACNILKSKLTRKGISYEDLSLALKKIGIDKKSTVIGRTINRGKFSHAFYLQTEKAVDIILKEYY